MDTEESAPGLQIAWHGEMDLPESRGQIYDPFPAIVRGRDANGVEFRVETTLDSFGPRWLCLRLGRELREGMRLFAIIRLLDADAGVAPPPRVAVRGVAERVERRPSQAYSVMVRVTGYRLLIP